MDKFLTNRWSQTILLLILLGVSIVFSVSGARWRDQIRNFTFDNYNIMKPRAASDNVVIVDIDELSLKEIGQMPWPRNVMARLVDNLKEMGAAVIVFDIVFSEPDRASPAFISKTLTGMEGFANVAKDLQNLPDNDILFGESLQKAGNVVTGFSFSNEDTDAIPIQKGIFRGKGIDRFVPGMMGATVNLKEISKDAAGNGSFFVYTDTDGIIRRVPMLVAHKRPDSNIVSVYPSLSLESIRLFEGERGGQVLLADSRYADLDPRHFGITGIEMGTNKSFIPTNSRGEFLVYFARSNPAWYVSARDVLNGTLPPEKIKGKIILVGTSAVGLKDIRSTPLDTFVPGVEVHLNIIDQILQGKFLKRSLGAEGLEAVSIFAMGLFIIICSSFIGALAQAAIVILVIAAAIFAGWYAFITYGLLIDVTYPSFCILAIFMLSTILTYLRTEKERRAVRQAFGLYISPDFMKELTKDPDKLRLGGESRELTVMFTDIRKFTTISEGMRPDELIQLMNDFLTPMSDLVMQNRGTIDKYMGDAMMAFWNAPLDDENHARHACLTALGMQQALTPINAMIADKAKKDGRAPTLLKVGIGLNTGVCAVGNMGSKQRFAYSVLGDTVNIASRLESQTKNYDVSNIISESTWESVRDFASLELDLVKVQGKTKPVRIFTLLGDDKFSSDGQFSQLKQAHDQMLVSYRAADFKKSAKEAAECEKIQALGLSGFYRLYQQRSEEFLKSPPKNWDGVSVALTK